MVLEGVLGSIASFGYQALFYFSFTMAIMIVLALFAIPIIRNRYYPNILLILRNTGGGGDTHHIVMGRKVFRRARIIETNGGARIKIWGVRNKTYPLTLMSKENAIPWEGGGEAFIIYEKEYGQFFPVNRPLDLALVDEKKRETKAKILDIYKKLREKFPELEGSIHLIRPGSTVAPVSFANHPTVLKVMPVDMVNMYAYDVQAAIMRTTKVDKWKEFLPHAMLMLGFVTLIVIAVLGYQYLNKQAQIVSADLSATRKSIVEDLAHELRGGGNEPTPPGGNQIFFPPIGILGGLPIIKRRMQLWNGQ